MKCGKQHRVLVKTEKLPNYAFFENESCIKKKTSPFSDHFSILFYRPPVLISSNMIDNYFCRLF